jgi:hypothetical protein
MVQASVLGRRRVVLPLDIRLVADQPKRTWMRTRNNGKRWCVWNQFPCAQTHHASVFGIAAPFWL